MLPNGLPLLSAKPSTAQMDDLLTDMAKSRVVKLIEKDCLRAREGSCHQMRVVILPSHCPFPPVAPK